MKEKAPISLAIIVKNEPFLEQCLLSIKDYVSEIIVVDTGSTDNTPEVAKKYADKFEVYTECNDPITGLIEDFSKARNYAFSLATYPWILWCDGDDIIEGAEYLHLCLEEFKINKVNLEKNGKKLDGVAFLFPYEYAYDNKGQCILRHYRERLISNKEYFNWVNPVHEVLVPKDGYHLSMIPKDHIIFKHQRQFTGKSIETGRNLRILKKYYEEVGDSDARQLYYLGLEYHNCGYVEDSIHYLKKYINLSGWEDEKVMACLKLVDIYHSLQNYNEALCWAFKAIEIKENWCEGYLALGKIFYFKGMEGGPETIRNWEKCVHFTREGLKLPPTKTLLFINPLDRDFSAHVYLNYALNKLGDVAGALESVNLGLKSQPNDSMLLGNKKIYEDFLARDSIVKASNDLKNNGSITDNAVAKITAIINNLETSIELTNKPATIKKKNILRKSRSKVLDIIFYIGNGVEIWSPETVKQTGIGGSELMALELAKRLATLGHKVRVYNSCGPYEGIYDGVEYWQTEKYHDLNCDVLIVSRNAAALDNVSITSKLKLLWVHDIYAINATSKLLLQADRILALSQWHKKFLMEHHHIHPDHIIVTRNGIDLTRFEYNIDRNKYKCINSSSPDRSWPVLLDVWPTIKNAVPQAELHLFYGFKNWEYSAQFDPKQQETIAKLKEKLNSLQNLGVHFHDRVDQATLAKELLSSGVWTYPTFFTETSCITAMEMQAAGVRMVTSNIAALTETVSNRGVLLDGDWTSDEYKNKFIEAVVEKLTQEDQSDRLELQKYAKENFDLDQLSLDWEDMFFYLLKEIEINPLINYFPTRSYLSRANFHSSPLYLTYNSELVKLNIGAGPNVFPFSGWINYDIQYPAQYFEQLTLIAKNAILPLNQRHPNTISWMNNMTPRQEKIINYLSNGGEIEYRIGDANLPFNTHPDNSVDIIYLGQMIEHLNPIYVVPNLLAECYRMLKPGGTLRITTPDLDLLIQAYLNNNLDQFVDEQPFFYQDADPSEQLAYIMYGACGQECSRENYEGHMFLFTKKSMSKALKNVGFEKIKFFNSTYLSDNPIILQEITDEGVSHSLLVEAIK